MSGEDRLRHGTRSEGPLPGRAREDLAASNVVVVDDHQANVALLEGLLKGIGIGRVTGFTDPRAALGSCTQSLPDLVLLDLHMPDLDGFAVMEELKRLLPPEGFLPVLVLTADVSSEIKEQALAAGAKDFVTKPFERTEVLLRVCNLLETRALHGRLERHTADLEAELEVKEAQEREAAAEYACATGRIDEALASGTLQMVFQAVADLTTGRVDGVEALARFACEPRRPPNEWFAEAQGVGRGVELELAAVRAALEQLDRLPPDAFMSINVSPATVMTRAVEELLDPYPAERVVLELTERTQVEDYPRLLTALDSLRGRGIRIAVDDTGAGYAGFEHLLRLRPHILKLDRELTRGIDADPIRRSLAAALVTFGHEIDAAIIAEGVEIVEELATLQQLGIKWGQGYYLARPGSLPLPERSILASVPGRQREVSI